MQVKDQGLLQANTDTRQPSVESLKDDILEFLSRFSGNLVSALDTKVTQIHNSLQSNLLIARRMMRTSFKEGKNHGNGSAPYVRNIFFGGQEFSRCFP